MREAATEALILSRSRTTTTPPTPPLQLAITRLLRIYPGSTGRRRRTGHTRDSALFSFYSFCLVLPSSASSSFSFGLVFFSFKLLYQKKVGHKTEQHHKKFGLFSADHGFGTLQLLASVKGAFTIWELTVELARAPFPLLDTPWSLSFATCMHPRRVRQGSAMLGWRLAGLSEHACRAVRIMGKGFLFGRWIYGIAPRACSDTPFERVFGG